MIIIFEGQSAKRLSHKNFANYVSPGSNSSVENAVVMLSCPWVQNNVPRLARCHHFMEVEGIIQGWLTRCPHYSVLGCRNEVVL